MRRELDALDIALGHPRHPVLGMVGGSKVSTKLDLLRNLITQAGRPGHRRRHGQHLPVGPGLGGRRLLLRERSGGHGPRDHGFRQGTTTASCCCRSISWWPSARRRARPPGSGLWARWTRASGFWTPGPRPSQRLTAAMDRSATLVWNGPLGVFEMPPFDAGTTAAARHAGALAKAGKLIAVAGGGDTVAALHHAGVDRALHLCLHGRRRFPGMDGRQDPARGRRFASLRRGRSLTAAKRGG